ncbi:ParB family chromosome partitioning protein [Neorhizobium galegae]|uniref:plasmid partitioning protein RepB n=1 Tax=Neorhizobium galegae TaxID=399 RepID=UPI001AE89839|nr:plasmid partitioning protein RepB [Neorhizobium galegae]MBP2550542.1 ParB family chromosome partitioning protein [Neorhizobium galegae]
MAGSRKNELKALFGGGLAPAPQGTPQPAGPASGNGAGTGQGKGKGDKGAPDAPSPTTTPEAARLPASPSLLSGRSASGAVKAMGLSLGSMSRDADEVRALRQALSEGERVISVATDRIEASFVEDRLRLEDRDDEDFASLVESMRDSGQQVPVLLRPHPTHEGRYQTAYGHRRIRAAARLGIEVKAVVRALTDDELVLAQGKENAERRNLSFIERAVFARNLAARGFDRKVIGEALSVQKSELSRLMQVVDSVPEKYIRLIGAAPKAGRDRWMKLGELLREPERQTVADGEVSQRNFLLSDSDQRFQTLFAALAAGPRKAAAPAAEPLELKDAQGVVFARLRRDGKAPRIEFQGTVDDAFLTEAAALLSERYQEFLAARKTG